MLYSRRKKTRLLAGTSIFWGYYSICTSSSLENAIRGNNLVYLGGVLVPILLGTSIFWQKRQLKQRCGD